jgi:penicillin-binding protein 2
VEGHRRNDTLFTYEHEKTQVEINADYYEFVVDGMEDVVTAGTARWTQTDSLSQCGKTGTAENPHGDDHSLFVAFAPKHNPEIAICVIVENAGFGSTYAAPIASLMMQYYVNNGRIDPKHAAMEERMLTTNLINDAGQE